LIDNNNHQVHHRSLQTQWKLKQKNLDDQQLAYEKQRAESFRSRERELEEVIIIIIIVVIIIIIRWLGPNALRPKKACAGS